MTFDDMLAETAEIAGVSVDEVERWRAADWERHLALIEARAAAMTAACDQAEALIADAARCGCRTVEAEVDDAGRPNLSTGRIVHTCGRTS